MYPKLVGKRNEKGLTQEQIANLLGISKGNYNLKENGKLDFNLAEVRKLLKILDESYEHIFFEENVTENSYKDMSIQNLMNNRKE